MDLPSSLSSNEKDLKQRRVVPESQTLCTHIAQIAYAAPGTKIARRKKKSFNTVELNKMGKKTKNKVNI